MLKAWHTHGNMLPGGADFYPLLPEVGRRLRPCIDSCAEMAVCTGETMCSTMLAWYASVLWKQCPIMGGFAQPPSCPT